MTQYAIYFMQQRVSDHDPEWFMGRVEPSTLPGGHVATTMHVGSYADLGAASDAAQQFLTDEGYEVAGAPWECYLDGPEVAEPRTEVFMPCRRLLPRGSYPSDS